MEKHYHKEITLNINVKSLIIVATIILMLILTILLF